MAYDTLQFKGPSEIAGLLMPELQKGFYIGASEGESVYTFLIKECGFSDDYISEKIKTVLIDGSPVDDIFNAGIKEGGVCALSGAMPGIVGAMMRIGSPYAPMRESITADTVRMTETGKIIVVGLKLFNTVLSDKGLNFLKTGILVDRERILYFLRRHYEELYSLCREITMNDIPVDIREMPGNLCGSMSDPAVIKIGIEDEDNC